LLGLYRTDTPDTWLRELNACLNWPETVKIRQEMIMAAKMTTTGKSEKISLAKRAFFVNLLDLSWRLFGAILLPILIGAYIDSRRGGDGQGFTIAGLLLGVVFSGLVIYSLVKKLMKQAEKDV